MANQSLTGMSATELAQRINAGEISAREVAQAHIDRIEAVNKRLNAVVITLFDEALAQAAAADEARTLNEPLGPLHGVPITLKEQLIVTDTDSTIGVPNQVGKQYGNEGPLISKLRRAGAIILGKTNLPQLDLANESDNDIYGRTNNPWNLDRTPGGSCGGEAAIIAAGGSPLGLGAEFMGSIRVPAHFCGIHGLKPTSGRLTMDDTPLHLILGAYVGQEAILAQPGPMARTVADLRLAMDVLAVPGKESTTDLVPPVPWSGPEHISVEGIRVGMYTDDGFFPASPAMRRAVQAAAEALRARGAQVETFVPPDVAEAMRIFLGIYTADGGASIKHALGGDRPHRLIKRLLLGAQMPNVFRPVIAKLVELFGQKRLAFLVRSTGPRSGYKYWQLVTARTDYRAKFLAAMDDGHFDAIICPPYPLPALTHGSSRDLFHASSYAILYNVVGMPAGVVAATRVRNGEESDRLSSKDITEHTAREVEHGSVGLPVGVQVAARHWREDIVLAVMAALEEHFRLTPDYPTHPAIPL